MYIRVKGEGGIVKHVFALQLYSYVRVRRRCIFCLSFLLFMFYVFLCNAVLSVLCSLVVAYWGADFLTLLYVMFPCDFVTFPYGVSGQKWYSIVSLSQIMILAFSIILFHFTLVISRFAAYLLNNISTLVKC